MAQITKTEVAMTREEERKEVAKNRANQYSHPVEWYDCYKHWIEGAEWADRTMIDRVCKFLKSYRQETSDGSDIAGVVNDKMIDDLRKAMIE